MHEPQLHWIQIPPNKSSPMAQGNYISKLLVLKMIVSVLHSWFDTLYVFRYFTRGCHLKLWILFQGYCSILQICGALRWVYFLFPERYVLRWIHLVHLDFNFVKYHVCFWKWPSIMIFLKFLKNLSLLHVGWAWILSEISRQYLVA